MLNNLTNFFNLIRGRKIKKTLANSDLIAIGVRDDRFDGNYQPSAIKFQDLQTQVLPSVDGVTITGDGTPGNPLVATNLWTTLTTWADYISLEGDTDYQSVGINPSLVAGMYLIEVDVVFAGANNNSDISIRFNTVGAQHTSVGHSTGHNTSSSAAIQGITPGVPVNQTDTGFGTVYSDINVPAIGKIYLAIKMLSSGTLNLQFRTLSPAAGRSVKLLRGTALRYRRIGQ